MKLLLDYGSNGLEVEFPDMKGKGSHPIYTTNRLLLSGWRGVIGVKTGFTSKAGRTYVGAATRRGRTLIVSLMGIKESSEAAAKKLLSWGFANADRVDSIGVLVEPGPVPTTTDSATTTVAQSVSAGVGGAPAQAAEESSVTSTSLGVPVVGVALLAGLVVAAAAWLRRRAAGRGRHASYSSGA